MGSGCSGGNRGRDSLLNSASATLELVVEHSDDAIPDSVLNAAKCVITVPFSTHGKSGDLVAVASCRDGSDWQTSIVTFTGRLSEKQTSALIIVILSASAQAALSKAELDIRRANRKPPLVSTKALVTASDLTSDYMVYNVQSSGEISPGDAEGKLQFPQGSKDSPALSKPSRPLKKYRKSLESFLNAIVPTGIVIHHTALISSDKLPNGEKEVDSYHQQRGFEIQCSGKTYHVAYHYLILPDGTVQRGRPERCEGAHARGYNSYLGISLIGDFSSRDNSDGANSEKRPTTQQMKSLVELCRRLRQKYNIPLQHIVRHSDIASTECPGDRFPFNEFLRSLQTTMERRSPSGK